MPTRIARPLLFLLARSTHTVLARHIEFLHAENEILRSKLPMSIRTTPAERNRLIKLGKPLGSTLKDLLSIVTYATFMGWMRKEDGKRTELKPTGRPPLHEDLYALILRLARENNWGYKRIHGELQKLGIKRISRTTIRNFLKKNGFEPSPHRGQGSWDQFLQSHLESLWACDFISKRILTKNGFVEGFVFFVIHLQSRRVHIAGVTVNPNAEWLAQQARNLTLFFDEQPVKPSYMLHDSDGKFTPQFRAILKSSGIEPKRLPVHAPNTNAFAERWVLSFRRECLDHFIVFGENHMRYLAHAYEAWYNKKRPHQGLSNRTIGAGPPPRCSGKLKLDEIKCESRLGGLLKHYYRDAA